MIVENTHQLKKEEGDEEQSSTKLTPKDFDYTRENDKVSSKPKSNVSMTKTIERGVTVKLKMTDLIMDIRK